MTTETWRRQPTNRQQLNHMSGTIRVACQRLCRGNNRLCVCLRGVELQRVIEFTGSACSARSVTPVEFRFPPITRETDANPLIVFWKVCAYSKVESHQRQLVDASSPAYKTE